MKILITGGAGFLGQRLARELLKTQQKQIITELVLADIAPLRDAVLLADPRVRSVTGDLRQLLADGVMSGIEGVFQDRKSTRLNSSHIPLSRMPSSA